MSSEDERVSQLSSWYIQEQLDFDKRLIAFRYQSIKPFFKGRYALELGPADGQMTQFLLDDFEMLTVVDGSQELLNIIPDGNKLKKVHCLFEEFDPEVKFDVIIMEHILEHVDNPIELLRRVSGWLSDFGRIIVGVPNGNSIHRLVAVKMGLLSSPCELNERDHKLGHRRVYVRETLECDLFEAGLEVETIGGVYFKPLSNAQIEANWDESMINGFYELGKDFPDLAAELYAICRIK